MNVGFVGRWGAAIVADRIDRAALKSLLGFLPLKVRHRLVKYDAETDFLLAPKDGRRGFPALVAIDALAGDVEGAGDVLRQSHVQGGHSQYCSRFATPGFVHSLTQAKTASFVARTPCRTSGVA